MKAFKISGCIVVALLGISLAARAAPSAHVNAGGAAEVRSSSEPVAPLPKRNDVVSWSRLAMVKTRERGGQVFAKFAPQVAALHQKRVRLQGYMQPLDANLVQRQFLLTIVPMTCPEDMPGGPVSTVYVRVADPVKFVMGPMVVERVLDVGRNPETGMYYRMSDAVLIRD